MIVVIGGHTRNIGKTTAVCDIIGALPDWNWTAIKITQYGHGLCSRNGEPCPCDNPTHPVAVLQEDGSMPLTDSGRFLGAGAVRAFWVRTPAGGLTEAMPRLRKIIAESRNVIVESNSLLRFLKPDYFAVVLNGAVADFKPSCRTWLDRADAVIPASSAPLAWADVAPSLLIGKPQLSIREIATAIQEKALRAV